ncbi:MAG TPA: hypothetical protein VJ890_11525 [Vineibacter sp.]|nr:hypothetical protein [Vineibacter sp.]
MENRMPSQRLFIIIGALVLVVVIGGLFVFTGGSGNQVADQPKIETPAGTPPAPSTPTPPSSDGKQ